MQKHLNLIIVSRFSGRRVIIVFALISLAIAPAADATYMLAKARLAQSLIERSWYRNDGTHPWPWADTAPVARLLIPALDLDTYVLDGATGAALAFGPGMVSGSAAPGQRGVTMIAAHRDTHFKALQSIALDHLITVQSTDRQWHNYQVDNIRIADSRVERIEPTITESTIVLVTCYPFDALLPGGPLRFVVEATLQSEVL